MIFEDPSRLRWRISVAVFASILLVSAVLSALFAASVFINPPLPSVARAFRAERTAIDIAHTVSSAPPAQTSPPQIPADTGTGSLGTLPRHGPIYATAFLTQGDPESVTSFQEHSSSLDAVFPDWFMLGTSGCTVDERIDPDVLSVLRGAGTPLLPRVSNGYDSSWHTAEINALLRNADTRACVVGVLATFAKTENVAGLNVDLETLQPSNRDNYLEFLIALQRSLHAQGQLLTVDVTINDPAYDLEQIGHIADAVLIMDYDQHYLSSPSGPIAGQEWFDDNMSQAIGSIPRSKLIVACGNYGDDWSRGQETQSMTFAETMALADDAGAQPEMDAESQNMHFRYRTASGAEHDVWFLNSMTLWNEVRSIQQHQVLGMGLWRLGSEDPTIWSFLGKRNPDVHALQTPAALRTILSISEGEVYRLRSSPQAGRATLYLGTDQEIEGAYYDALPAGYLLERVGAPFPDKTLVLTFDDGPDPVWTPQILSLLEQEHIPATFFVVGQQGAEYPSILAKIAQDGELIGNHTYLHPNISLISPERMRLELTATQRVIEESYGRKSTLFRSPYDTDSNPSEPAQLDPLATVNDLGYIVVGANIDPNDWRKPGVQAIVDSVEKQVQNPNNHIIVLHDGGGDRSQTVAALRILLPALQREGFRFVSLNEAIGVPASTLVPAFGGVEELLVRSNLLMHTLLDDGWVVIAWLFLFTTILAIVRILFLGVLVVRSEFKSKRAPALGKQLPRATVLIPAYNEEKTLAKTIHSLLPHLPEDGEVLVVDDGSTDGTAALVRALSAGDPRVQLLSQKNTGKAMALNNGFRAASHDIVITIDADTIVLPATIPALLAPFQDPAVDAVCGNVEVGNVHNILTGFQALEYITTQNFDRRAFEELNCISVVPGATGAWRRQRVLDIGGYQSDTLTEDADLTLMLLRAGGKIAYAPDARSRTEAPHTVATLAQQRFRWSYGTSQCLWKHRDMFFHGTLGWVALPNMFFFQILFPILSPIGDIVFLLSLLRGDVGAIAVGYILFLFMDLCGSLLAFTLERRPRRLMWLILIQRFFYRQFMYVVTFRSIIAILHGRKRGWNKLDRQGTVKVASEPL